MRKVASVIALSLLLAPCAQAASVHFMPSNSTVAVGQAFSMDLMGVFSAGETIEGGGLNLSYNPSVVKVTGITVNSSLFTFFSSPGTIDNISGKVQDTIFNRFEGANGHFLIATVNFEATGLGSTSLDLSESSLNPFSSASAGSSLNVLFDPGSVAAVPLPAAVWLALSGLLGLSGIGIRRRPRTAR